MAQAAPRCSRRRVSSLTGAWLAVCVLVQPALGQDAYRQFIPDTPPRTPEQQRQMFHLPPGFEIQLVAAEPEIRKPINIAFDARGRLWATGSVEYPFPAKDGATTRDTVRVFQDFAESGRARRATTFAEGLNIPIGLLPVGDGCIVHSIPNIYRLRDSDGDARADQRELLYGSVGYRDTHGMVNSFTWGFDGWIYACHGFSNDSELVGRDGQKMRLNSGNTFRMRPDGSHIEQFTHGQVNPFGLAFDPLGNLFSSDCHSRPVSMLLRGGYYSSFGKPHDGLGFVPEICRHDHGSTAIAGIVYYAADQFPPEYRDTVFVGNVVTNRINHDRLERRGSTYEAIEQPDFLSCDDPWFRPVSLVVGPDGAMYVADFYNRVIGHYEVPLTHPARDRERGRIWRIVYRRPDGKRQATMPRGDWTKVSVEELIADLGHPNLVVRITATNQLVDRIGKSAIGPVRRLASADSSPFQRMHAAWVLERLDALDDATLESLLKDSDPGVRTHVMKLLTERSQLTSEVRAMVRAGLRDSDAFVQRAAVEALARHPAEENLQPLLALRSQIPPQDTLLLHAIRMALRDQLREEETLRRVAASRQDERIARDLADVAPGVPTPPAGALLLAHIESFREDRDTTARYVRHVARYVSDGDLPRALAVARRRAGSDLGDQLALVRALREGLEGRGKSPDAELVDWAVGLARELLATKQPAPANDAIELARTMKLKPLEPGLVAIAHDSSVALAQRSAAIGALVAIQPGGHVELFGDVLADSSEPVQLRQQVAGVLGGMNRAEVNDLLAERLRSAPEQLGVHIAAALASGRDGAEKLLSELATGKASARLLLHPLVRGRLEATKLANLNERIARLTEGLPPAEDRLQKLIDERRAGFAKAKTEAAEGAKLFEKHCAACHSIGGKGAKVGPQLDGIGSRGADRLFEDVLDPNRNVDEAFRASLIALKNGQVLTGLVTRDEAERLAIVDSAGKELVVAKSDIEDRTVSKLSPMPANVAELMNEQEFYHLLAYLLSRRESPTGTKQ